MALPNIFSKDVADNLVSRINQLRPNTTANWGKMNAAQMLAHCNVTYEMVYEDKHPAPNFLMKLILQLFIKKSVVNEVPYKHNSQTAPQFKIADPRDFETEKKRLANYISTTQHLGERHFEGLESNSFGKLNPTEWNNMFYKHLHHHLTQFGV